MLSASHHCIGDDILASTTRTTKATERTIVRANGVQHVAINRSEKRRKLHKCLAEISDSKLSTEKR